MDTQGLKQININIYEFDFLLKKATPLTIRPVLVKGHFFNKFAI